MELTISLPPDQKAIALIDRAIDGFTSIYNLPHKRELCFVAHELVINSVEAMRKANRPLFENIQINFSCLAEKVQIVVMDSAGGIPSEDWEDFLQLDIDQITYSDRGRGIFFVKSMVDEIWFDQTPDNLFIVGVSKGIAPKLKNDVLPIEPHV